jgi:uncharacterized protein YqhQ
MFSKPSSLDNKERKPKIDYRIDFTYTFLIAVDGALFQMALQLFRAFYFWVRTAFSAFSTSAFASDEILQILIVAIFSLIIAKYIFIIAMQLKLIMRTIIWPCLT